MLSGSRLLSLLFDEFGSIEYDKVRDGRALAADLLANNPAILEPLREAVRSVKEAPADPA